MQYPSVLWYKPAICPCKQRTPQKPGYEEEDLSRQTSLSVVSDKSTCRLHLYNLLNAQLCNSNWNTVLISCFATREFHTDSRGWAPFPCAALTRSAIRCYSALIDFILSVRLSVRHTGAGDRATSKQFVVVVIIIIIAVFIVRILQVQRRCILGYTRR